MTEKQKEAIMILNNIRAVSKALSEENYFLLLDFIVGQPPIVNIPFQRETPYPYETWITTSGYSQPEHPLDELNPIRYENNDQQKEDEMSYGDRLIKEGRSPL